MGRLIGAFVLLCLLAAVGLARSRLDGIEFVVDTRPVYGAALGPQLNPAVCSDGSDFFVVWEDGRVDGDWNVYGNRVSRAGQVLGAASICLVADSGNQFAPAVAFDGTYYLVVWTDMAGGAGDIRAARVTHGGEVFETLTVSSAAGQQGNPAVAFNGANYLVAWEDHRTGQGDIRAARVSQTGQVLDPDGITLSAATGLQARPAVVFDGRQFLVAWLDERNGQLERDIFATRVAASGAVLDTAGIAVSTASGRQQYVAASSNGSVTVLAWGDSRNGSYDIYAARVNQSGTVLDPGGIAVSTAPNWQVDPCVAFDGTNFLVAWKDSRTYAEEINGARLTPAGTVLDTSGFEICDWRCYQGEPAAACAPGYWLVAWSDERNVHSDVFASRVRPDGSVPDPDGILLSGSANEQRMVSSACDGGQFLVVWQDARVDNYNHGIFGARVTEDGMVRDTAAIGISATGLWERQPAVGSDGSSFFVAWSAIDSQLQTVHLYGAQVLPDGQVANRGVVCGAEGSQTFPAVAGGPRTLVAWQDSRSGPCDIYAARVTRQGVVMDPQGIPVSTAPGNQYYAAAALGSDSFLVVWQDDRNGGLDIYAARVTQAGAVLDTAGIGVAAAPDTQSLPAVAFGNADWLVVWQDRRDGANCVYCARVTAAGVVLDPDGILIAAGVSPCVVFDGTDFIVAWQDKRADAGDIRAARVGPDGTVLDSALVVGRAGGQAEPAIAGNGGQSLLLAWCGWTSDFGQMPYNTYRAWAKTPPFFSAVDECAAPGVARAARAATIVRGVLCISRQLTADGSRQELLDALGRRVLSLRPGPNDVSSLAAGVYFIESTIDHRQSPIARVVITR